MNDSLQNQNDPHDVAAYLAHQGLHGLLKMHEKPDLEIYDHCVKKGHKCLDKGIESLFSGETLPEQDITKAKKTIQDWMSKGGITHDVQEEVYNKNSSPQDMAEGGEIKKEASEGVLHGHPIAQAYPEQNIALQTAKGRTSAYLNTLRPQEHIQRLAFDEEPDQTMQKKSYDRALNIAANPLSVLHKVKKGTLEPEHVQHLNGLYPEINDALQKKMTKRIVEAQLKGEKPNYTVRQGLSLLMGAPLSGELLPQNIQAAQAVFQPKPSSVPQEQSTSGTKKSKKSALTKSDQSFLTGNQALVERSQKQ
jgi:hypothetical protein